jgi:hypothetical protein
MSDTRDEEKDRNKDQRSNCKLRYYISGSDLSLAPKFFWGINKFRDTRYEIRDTDDQSL